MDNAQKIAFLSDQEKEQYQNLLNKIFELTDSEVISSFNANGNNYFYKFGILNCFKHDALPYNISYIIDYDCVKEQILVQYYSRQKTSIESIRFDGNEVYHDYEKIIEHNFLDKVFCYEKLLWVHVPKFSKDKLQIFIDGKQSMIGFKNYDYSINSIRKEFDLYNNIEDICLFIDRAIEADDNAERLYRYVAKNYSNQKIVFALMKDLPRLVKIRKRWL
ncbi:hypothetical protein [Campylobacter sp. P0109]|uniref:hypothetical protein n=1 Tax=Campylobacter sp. P0109 TaxID=1895606 RepID=UPI000BB41849|nr:hypothetical protein [Campylobacter sp. P0109]